MPAPRLPLARAERKRDVEAETRRALYADAASRCYGGVTRHIQDELGTGNSMRYLEELGTGEKQDAAELLERRMVISLAQPSKRVEDALAPLILLCQRMGGRFVPEGPASPAAQLHALVADHARESADVQQVALRRCLDQDGMTPRDALALLRELDEQDAMAGALRSRALEVLAVAGIDREIASPDA